MPRRGEKDGLRESRITDEELLAILQAAQRMALSGDAALVGMGSCEPIHGGGGRMAACR